MDEAGGLVIAMIALSIPGHILLQEVLRLSLENLS